MEQFVIHQQDKRWVVDSYNGKAVQRSEHTSKRKALLSLERRTISCKVFYLIIPNEEDAHVHYNPSKLANLVDSQRMPKV